VSDQTQIKPDPKPFGDWLNDQRRGATHSDLSEALNQVVHSVAEYGKVGELTLKLKIKPSGDGMVTITDEVVTKVPEPDRSASLYFYDDEGNLSREDPRQIRLDLPVDDNENVRHIK
jgi:hypothetical protein